MSTYKRLPSFSASSSLLTRPHTVPARWILRRGMIMAAVIFSTYANRSIESGSTPRIDTDNWKGLPAMGAWRRGRRRCLEPGREKEEGDSGFSCSIVSRFTVFLGLGLVRLFRFRSCPGTVQGQDRSGSPWFTRSWSISNPAQEPFHPLQKCVRLDRNRSLILTCSHLVHEAIKAI